MKASWETLDEAGMCQFWSWERCHSWVALHCKVVTMLLTCNFSFPIPFEETFSNFLFLFFLLVWHADLFFCLIEGYFSPEDYWKRLLCIYIWRWKSDVRGLYKYQLLHLAWSCCACSCDAGVELVFTPIAFVAKLKVSTTSPKPSCCKASFPLACLFFNYCQREIELL